MEHKHKGGTGWVIALVILVAILVIVGMIMPKKTERTDMNQNQEQMMQESDDLDSISSDIDGNLETDFQTNDLGY